MARDAAYWIERLGLSPHPEGGFYRETYRSAGAIPASALRGAHAGPRAFATAIYYLLRSDEVSTLHRLRSDELFHHYDGAPLSIHVIDTEGEYRCIELAGRAGDGFQALVPAGCWFGATVERPASFALVGCTVAPGFDFEDFEQAERERMLERYPRHRGVVERLTP